MDEGGGEEGKKVKINFKKKRKKDGRRKNNGSIDTDQGYKGEVSGLQLWYGQGSPAVSDKRLPAMAVQNGQKT